MVEPMDINSAPLTVKLVVAYYDDGNYFHPYCIDEHRKLQPITENDPEMQECAGYPCFSCGEEL